VWQGMAIAIAGIAMGVVAALALTRVIASLLYDVTPTDPGTLAVVASGLAITAFASALSEADAEALSALGATIAPTVALIPLSLLYPLPGADLFANWRTWWQGDTSGILIFTPLILSWSVRGAVQWTPRRVLEGLLLAALLLAATHVAFGNGFGRTFVIVPLIVWAAFRFGQPEIWNSDQGSQFTSPDFLAPLKKRDISISMDGRGRALDNVFIERLWRSLKYELIYPGDFASGAELFPALDRYFHFYNFQRPHQALGYRTPADLFPHRSIRKRSSL